ncbi:MAG TPA: exodeoxyribonuclease VII large subunit [Usitatibacter sp.]|nr:exodeoxyribonuclease VII large subunit [Usitatibacter sp.]
MRPLFPTPEVVTVSDLNRKVRTLLENQFETLWVGGEVSGVKKAPSGHWYFCLKDSDAEVQCVMYRSRAQFLDFRPENGQQVEVRARVTLYEPRGTYQLTVDEMRKAGLGALYEAFEKLKTKLEAEGLFAPERKRSLPAFPRAIGIVTSPQAAALRDVLTTLSRRARMVPIVVYPAQVQGETAAAQIARAIRVANVRSEVDVLVLCRGGGSLEDLWAFNEEVVARAIAASRLPVVSGVGHETDFSICDFVADVRAPTPTAAAAMASPDREALCEAVGALRRRLARDLTRIVERASQRVDAAARRLLTPAERLARNRERLVQVARRMRIAAARERQSLARDIRNLAPRLRRALPLREREQRVAALRNALAHLDPTRVLARGYSIVRDASGHVRITSGGLRAGDALDITFSEGGAAATVAKPR